MTATIRREGNPFADRLPMTAAALRRLNRSIRDTSQRVDAFAEEPEISLLEDRRLRLMLDAASRAVVEPAAGRVIIGVDVFVRDGGRRTRYQITPPGVSGWGRHAISADSPLGLALLGRRAGEHAVVNAPVGERTVEILDVQ